MRESEFSGFRIEPQIDLNTTQIRDVLSSIPTMRALQEAPSQPRLPIPLSPTSNSTLDQGVSGSEFYSWLGVCHGFWHNVALIVPSMLFVLYLGYQSRKSFSKLSHGRSYIMIAYYGCLWGVSLLNLAWCCLQASTVYYHAFYLPLLYITFLADFFQEEDLHLENVYYSEMKDAGFFDADWE